MNTIMKERWTEAQVEGLPPGEHDYFERKSGALLADSEFAGKLGKALSAFANSGGGHIILGIKDDGTFDGVEAIKKGRTLTRDWLEQVVPNLVNFPLQQFRVHEVEPSANSLIPVGMVVIVLDIGDSPIARHEQENRSSTITDKADALYLLPTFTWRRCAIVW